VDDLEIQTKDGEWISYKFSPNSFIVMAEELFLVGHFLVCNGIPSQLYVISLEKTDHYI